MSLQKKITKSRERRKQRVRSKIHNVERPRLSVFRSLKHIYAQIIDDIHHKTIVSFSSLSVEKQVGDKQEQAKNIGKELAKLAKEQGIHAVAFDRGSYLYHGRIKALADGLREGGLEL